LKQSRLWPAGTVCITIAANIADSGILTYKACFPDSVVGFIADARLCSPEFVEFFIRTARENLSAFASETTQKNINLEILREVAVPVPPLKEQREIVRCVEVLFKLADAIEKRVAAATARAEKLKQSILAKAFRGELVPTEAELARRDGRIYEPASALLGRIKSEENSPVTAKQLSFSLQTRAIRKKRRAMVR
jgi:type I restriction enzyme S subunit